MKQTLCITPSEIACLFIDMQEEHRHDSRYLVDGYEQVLHNAAQLQEQARSLGIAVLHSAYIVDSSAPCRPFHPRNPDGTSAFSDSSDPLTAICPEVAPKEGEPTFIKNEASAFGDGQVQQAIADLGATWVLISGVWTEACIDASVKAAVTQGLRVLLVKDACGSGRMAMHQTGILNLANRLYGGAVVDTKTALALLAGEEVMAWQNDRPVPLLYTLDTAAPLYDAL